jgi:vanillate O-demethylase monooxygenase subunit
VTNAANYPFWCWYVAATSDEVSRGLLARRVLGQDVILFRRTGGDIVALEDRCPHRSFPLSAGRIEGDTVVCGYHGFAFGHDGRCVRIPSQGQIPERSSARAFAVREDPPFVWIWLGDGESWRKRPLPELPWLHDSTRAVWGGTLEIQCNYTLLHEMILDLTHIPFVYPDISPQPLMQEVPPLEVDVSEHSVAYIRTFPAVALTSWQARSAGLPADAVRVQQEFGELITPAVWAGGWRILGEDERTVSHELLLTYSFTPIDMMQTRVVYRGSRTYAVEDGAVTAEMQRRLEEIFARRKSILELAQRRRIEASDGREFSVIADAAQLKARRIVETMLAEEAGMTLRARRRGAKP